jgi:hypothetical protein
MAYINKGDFLEYMGSRVIAVGEDFTRLVYDSQDLEASYYDSSYEGGSARGAVRILQPNTGRSFVVDLKDVKKLSPT